MAQNQSEALGRLREIILCEEETRVKELRAELRRLQGRLDDTGELLQKLEPVIADTLAIKIRNSQNEMAEVLGPVMGPAIKYQIQNAKEDMVDALYPVIGSTIRKSVAEAMKELVRALNQRIDDALSKNRFLRRFQSTVSGVSETDLLLKQSLPFQIHQLLLIHKETGILLVQVSGINASSANKDLVSGMLTAIRDFAQTALTPGEGRELTQIKYEDLDIYLDDSKYSTLAIVAAGQPPPQFTESTIRCQQKIHNQFYKLLRSFSGDTSQLSSCVPILESLYRQFSLPESNAGTSASKSGKATGIIALLLLLLLFAVPMVLWLKLGETPPEPAKINHSALVLQIRDHLNSTLEFDSSNLKFIWDDDMLTLAGEGFDGQQRLELAKSVAQVASVSVIINEIATELQPRAMPENVRQQIENTVIYFPHSVTQLTDVASSKLQALVPLLAAYPKQTITIRGHSDLPGDAQANLLASRKRAEQVRTTLAQAGVELARMTIVASGADEPAASNDTEEGRGKNRRVNFKLPRTTSFE